jgi:LSU ribosomal protein L31P
MKMKKNIHPTYYKDAVIRCACGHEVVTGFYGQRNQGRNLFKVPPLLHRTGEEGQ